MRGALQALIALAASLAVFSSLAPDGPSYAIGGKTTVSVDGFGNAGQYVSMELDGSGNPILGYFNGSLSILRCGDPTCSSGNSLVHPDSSVNSGYYSSLGLDAAGNPAVTYVDVNPNGSVLRLLRCGTPDCTIGNSVVSLYPGGAIGEYPVMRLNATDNAVIAFADDSHGQLKLVTCADPTCQTSATVSVDSGVPLRPSLVLDSAGRPVVSYFHGSSGDLKVVRCGNTACSSGNSTASIAAADSIDPSSSITLDNTDRPVVSFNDSSGQLAVLRCGNATCTSGNTITHPDSPGALSSLELDPSGNPVVSHQGRILHCDDTACEGSEAANIQVPDSTSVDASSMELDSAGNPVVGYYDSSNGTLKVLHCNDPACADGNDSITLPDPARSVGQESSIAIDGAGNPVISYYDRTNGDLRVAQCGASDCSSGNVIVAADSAGNVGLDSSLALDTLGRPVVAFYDITNNALKLLRCGMDDCTAGNNLSQLAVDNATDISVAVGTNDVPSIAYFDPDEDALKIVHCGEPLCLWGNTTAVIAPVAEVSNLVLDSLDRPMISYTDLTSYPAVDLHILRCGDATCLTGNTVLLTPDSPNADGPSGVAFDPAGNPIVSYNATAALRYLRCGDATCSSGNVLKTLMSPIEGPVLEGLYLTTGNPVLLFRTLVGGYLVHSCIDLDCSSDNRYPAPTLPGSHDPRRKGVALAPNNRPVYSTGSGTEGLPGDLYIIRCDGFVYTGNPCSEDFDYDGCPDEAERAVDTGSELLGGRRDPKNQYDYFNPSHDGQNRVDDILLVVDAYFKDDNDGNPGLPPFAPGYDQKTDRTLLGPDPWDTGPPNGLQRVDDILNQVKQYFHDCA